MYWIIFGITVLLLFYIYGIRPLGHFKNRNISYESGLPFVGNFLGVLLRTKHMFHIIRDWNKIFPGEKAFGAFQFNQPIIVIKDLELVKQLGVKYFDHAMNHRGFVKIDSEIEPVFSRNLFNLSDDRWREMRATLSPSFTGSKMKAMFVLISEYAEDFVDYFVAKKEEIIEVDVKDVFTKYTNDVIASIAFGLKCDSLRDENNSFYSMGKIITNLSGFRSFKFFLISIFPKLAELLKMNLFPKSATEFFTSVITETIAIRTEKGIVRPDMIHLLLEARKGKLTYEDEEKKDEQGFAVIEESDVGRKEIHGKHEISDMDITAQAMIFFFAGFDTSSTVLSFAVLELAINPEVQAKLVEEIHAGFDKDGGKITYDTVMRMKYLDMVISESLRKWPPAPATDRLVNKKLLIPATKPEERPLELLPGDMLFFPITAFHYDEKYFPNPNVFDPERFSDENKHNILPYSYLPFGIGPRACIASRFALMEVKIILVHLLNRFELVPVKRTCVPIQLAPDSLFQMRPKGGYILGLKARQ